MIRGAFPPDIIMARWITRVAYPGTHYPFFDSHCSNCGFKTAMVLDEWNCKCPKCGASMEDEKPCQSTRETSSR